MTPKDVGSTEPFVEAARKGMSEFVVLTTVKARPVLVITPVLPEHDEVLALRLRRFEKLSSDTVRQHVRAGSDPALFPLNPERFPGLSVHLVRPGDLGTARDGESRSACETRRSGIVGGDERGTRV